RGTDYALDEFSQAQSQGQGERYMKAILASVLMGLVAVAAAAQTPRVYGRLTHRMETAKVKRLNKDLLTFSPLPGVLDISVKVSADTRLTKDNMQAHLQDIKEGNYVPL